MRDDGYRFADLDRSLSPLTGLGREHWESAADYLLEGAQAWTGDAPWHYRFPGPASANGERSDQLEAFARLALLAAFRSAQAPESLKPAWLERILEGLEGAGSALARGDGSAWPSLRGGGQPLVEASSIALALLTAPERLWEPLSARARSGLVGWLQDGLGHDLRWNNWAFFEASIAMLLERVHHLDGGSYRQRLIRRIEPWYIGDGWYSDGPGVRLDYYNAWSFHFYVPLLNHLAPDNLLDEAAHRVGPFLEGHSRLFDDRGAPVLFGRSLTYRFATVAPFFTAQLLSPSRPEPGRDRYMASRTLRWFVEEGALADGRLSLGWRGELPGIAQGYSSGGSPLWAAKAFVGLLLPPDHAVWADAEPPQNSLSNAASTIGGGSLVAHRTRAGSVILYPCRVEPRPRWAPDASRREPLYSKLAYSSITAPEIEDSSAENDATFTGEGLPRGFAGPVDWSAVGPDWCSTSAGVWHERPAPRWMTYRVAKSLRVASWWWQPRRWRPAKVGVMRLLHHDYEVRLFALSRFPRGALARFGAFAVAGDHAAQSVHALLGDLAVDDRTVEMPNNPFGEQARVPEMTFRVTEDFHLVGFAVSLDSVATGVRVPPTIERAHKSAVAVAFADGQQAEVSWRGTRMTGAWKHRGASGL